MIAVVRCVASLAFASAEGSRRPGARAATRSCVVSALPLSLRVVARRLARASVTTALARERLPGAPPPHGSEVPAAHGCRSAPASRGYRCGRPTAVGDAACCCGRHAARPVPSRCCGRPCRLPGAVTLLWSALPAARCRAATWAARWLADVAAGTRWRFGGMRDQICVGRPERREAKERCLCTGLWMGRWITSMNGG